MEFAREVLLPGLPYALQKFDKIFLGAVPISSDYRDAIIKEGSVINGGKVAVTLANYGVTPVTILEACEAVANLANRYCDEHKIDVGGRLILDRAHKKNPSYIMIPRDISIGEVALMTQLNMKTAERLFGWVGHVAEYVPKLFNGFEAELWGDVLRLTRTDVTSANLFEQWAPMPPERVAA